MLLFYSDILCKSCLYGHKRLAVLVEILQFHFLIGAGEDPADFEFPERRFLAGIASVIMIFNARLLLE